MDEKAAQTIACIVREDLEPRTLAQGQSLVIAAALNQRAAGGTQTYAELLFGLKSMADKCAWIQRCALSFSLLFTETRSS
jgi:hypothetical protein